jgi:hypothetical protein
MSRFEGKSGNQRVSSVLRVARKLIAAAAM